MLNPGYYVLLAIYALWGFTSLFAFWPAVVKSLREISNENEQSKAFGFFDGGRGIVYAIDGVCIVSIFAYFSKKAGDVGGLNGVIIYYSVIAIVLGILVFFLLKGSEKEKVAVVEEKKEKITVEGVLKVLKMPAVWFLSIILCCTYTMNIAFYYFTPYSTSAFGMAGAAAAIITIAAQYVRPVASFGGGALADKFGRSRVLYVTFTMMMIPTFMMVFMHSMSSTLFIALCIIIYVGMYGGYSLVWSMMDEGGIPLSVAGTAVGVISTIGFFPEVAVPYLFGKVLDVFGDKGYDYMFTGIGICFAIGIVTLVIWDRYRKKLNIQPGSRENTETAAEA